MKVSAFEFELDDLLGAIAVYMIEQELKKAAAFCFAGSLLAFFGFMHGEAVGFAVSPEASLAYLVMAAVMLLLSRSHVKSPMPVETHAHD